jgi:hypothetical protein
MEPPLGDSEHEGKCDIPEKVLDNFKEPTQISTFLRPSTYPKAAAPAGPVVTRTSPTDTGKAKAQKKRSAPKKPPFRV